VALRSVGGDSAEGTPLLMLTALALSKTSLTVVFVFCRLFSVVTELNLCLFQGCYQFTPGHIHYQLFASPQTSINIDDCIVAVVATSINTVYNHAIGNYFYICVWVTLVTTSQIGRHLSLYG